jgi:ATP-dependent Clp protease ATP-binding subunit ClpA
MSKFPTLDKIRIHPVYCLNEGHVDGPGFFFVFAGEEVGTAELRARLNELGCPLGCGEKEKFNIGEPSLTAAEFFTQPEEEITQAFFLEEDSFSVIDLQALGDTWEEYWEEIEEPLEEKLDLDALEAYLKKWIVGQPVAIRKTMRVVKIGETGWRVYEHQPKGIVLMLGPTASGKTELVRRFAMFMNGVTDPFLTDDRVLIKLDMSEYQQEIDAKKITGAAPMYVGFGVPTALSRVEKFETAVILLDEIEKAHPDILDIFLQIFEDGVLTVMAPNPEPKSNRYEDQYAEKKIRFGNAYFFLTSNLGSEEIDVFLRGTQLGFHVNTSDGRRVDDANNIREAPIKAMKKKLRPEFIGRLDEVIVFYPLTGEETLNRIIGLRIEELQPTLAKHGITLEVSPEAYAFLREKGFDITRGARSIKQAVRKYVMNTLAQAEREGKIKPGDLVILKGPIKKGSEDEEKDEGFVLDFEVQDGSGGESA